MPHAPSSVFTGFECFARPDVHFCSPAREYDATPVSRQGSNGGNQTFGLELAGPAALP
jgi:hypothetical protein